MTVNRFLILFWVASCAWAGDAAPPELEPLGVFAYQVDLRPGEAANDKELTDKRKASAAPLHEGDAYLDGQKSPEDWFEATRDAKLTLPMAKAALIQSELQALDADGLWTVAAQIPPRPAPGSLEGDIVGRTPSDHENRTITPDDRALANRRLAANREILHWLATSSSTDRKNGERIVLVDRTVSATLLKLDPSDAKPDQKPNGVPKYLRLLVPFQKQDGTFISRYIYLARGPFVNETATHANPTSGYPPHTWLSDLTLEQIRQIRVHAERITWMIQQANTPAMGVAATALEFKYKGWRNYLISGYSQYPWELLVNHSLNHASDPASNDAPSRQLVVLHPELGISMATDRFADVKPDVTVLLHVIGEVFYRNGEEPNSNYWGAAATVGFSTTQGMGVGATLLMGGKSLSSYLPPLSIGVQYYDNGTGHLDFDHSPAITLGIDLAALLSKNQAPAAYSER